LSGPKISIRMEKKLLLGESEYKLNGQRSRPEADWTNCSQLDPALELSTLDCSSTHNTLYAFQRTIGPSTSHGLPWL